MDPIDDLTPSDLIYSLEPRNVGETFLVKYNPAHTWFYWSEMQPHEALALKCYDTASVAGKNADRNNPIAALVPHTAFADPKYENDPDVEPRERCVIVF